MIQELILRYPDPKIFSLGISINHEELSRELYDLIIKYRPILKGVVSKKRIITESIKPIIFGNLKINYYLIFQDPLSKEDLKNCLSFPHYFKILNELKAKYNNIEGVYCSGFINSKSEESNVNSVRCPAGTNKLSIMPDGSVYPCYLFFRNTEFRLGNILEDDFEKIWRSPTLDFFRNFNGNNCSILCELHKICHGGCPAVSLLIYGDLKRADPRCKELIHVH